MRPALALASAALILAGCSSAGSNSSPLIPDKKLLLTAKTSLSLSRLATGALIVGAIYFIYDPLAPNWEIEETRVDEDTFRLALRMKRYHTGGAGESIQALRRRAAQLQGDLGYGGYQIVEYTEGIDSQTLGARRVADGVIRLVQRREADSFLQNAAR
ncbi:MAG: hypothetical protein JNM32_04120 [Dechloromonas sp.]|jgi:hypothetical protein|nr:hypothetical protein [Dechloromonas sp.]